MRSSKSFQEVMAIASDYVALHGIDQFNAVFFPSIYYFHESFFEVIIKVVNGNPSDGCEITLTCVKNPDKEKVISEFESAIEKYQNHEKHSL